MHREQHREEIKIFQENLSEKLSFKDGKFTVFTSNSEYELSEGCKSCKNGTWLCLFTSNICNARCKFCPRTHTQQDYNSWTHPRSIVNHWIDDVKGYMEIYGERIKGVSYSGGEPLLQVPKIMEIASYTSLNRPDIYQWCYTNGIEANIENLVKLASVGIKEIRFDLAATYFNENVLENLRNACGIFERVTVEIPSMQETRDKLIKEEYLDRLVEYGVKQLNLAELELVQPINWETYGRNKEIYIYENANMYSIALAESRYMTYEIMKYAIDRNLNILINDCSLQAKEVQAIKRNLNGLNNL